jgi:Flp pilus assembly protein TadB
MIWFVLLIYLLIPALGLALLWVAYQVQYKKRYSLLRDHQRTPLANGQLIAGRFACMAACGGGVVLALAAAIPFARLPFGTWHFYIFTIAACMGIWWNLLMLRYKRLERSNLNLKQTPDDAA